MAKLGVNIDHVATLREARKGIDPDPVFAAIISEASGADSVVCHLREDRRHIKDADLYILKKTVKTRLNLEMACTEEIIRIACDVKPDQATLVPERRRELTTEGGLDVIKNVSKVKYTVSKLQDAGIEVSLFIDPDMNQIDAAIKTGTRTVELHTGRYADALNVTEENKYFRQIERAAKYAKARDLIVNAGHGLDYFNTTRIAGIKEIEELNIGYSIICKAVLVGLEQAVQEMKELAKGK